jgi:hypothetical protein
LIARGAVTYLIARGAVTEPPGLYTPPPIPPPEPGPIPGPRPGPIPVPTPSPTPPPEPGPIDVPNETAHWEPDLLNTAGRERLRVEKHLGKRSDVRGSIGGRSELYDSERHRIGPYSLGVPNGFRMPVSTSPSASGWVGPAGDEDDVSHVTAIDNRGDWLRVDRRCS